jgi:hypothetical protein
VFLGFFRVLRFGSGYGACSTGRTRPKLKKAQERLDRAVGPDGPEDNPKNILMLTPGFLFLSI